MIFVKPISFKRHRFPADVSRQALWLYVRFSLNFRDIEEVMAGFWQPNVTWPSDHATRPNQL